MVEGVEGAEVCGVEKAPVLWRWSCSKISCSSFGRRGGAGDCDHELFLDAVEMKVRRMRRRFSGRGWRRGIVCVLGCCEVD